jgi:hypothetical protein
VRGDDFFGFDFSSDGRARCFLSTGILWLFLFDLGTKKPAGEGG